MLNQMLAAFFVLVVVSRTYCNYVQGSNKQVLSSKKVVSIKVTGGKIFVSAREQQNI